MSVGDRSYPDLRGENVEVNQQDIAVNLADVSATLNGHLLLVEERSSDSRENPSGDFNNVNSEDRNVDLDGIGAIAASNQSVERVLLPSDMSADVENAQADIVQDDVDNLHGLSIAANSGERHCGEENDAGDLVDGKAERMNPFNSGMNQTRPKPSRYTEPMPKFLSLDSFGSESPTPTSLLEDDIAKLQLGGATVSVGDCVTPDSPKFNGGDMSGHNSLHNFSPHHVGFDHDIIPPTVPPPPSDPWVRLSPDISPIVEKPQPPISPKMEQKITPEKTLNSNERSQNALCLDGELKKAPVIDPSASLSPMVLDIPGPCEPEDLIEGIIFSANYLGTTQLVSNRNPAKNARMFQAQEAVNRIKAPDGESQPTVEVDLFISTTKIKILNADTQETMMSHTLRSISYIADIGDLLVVMAKRHPSAEEPTPEEDGVMRKEQAKKHRIICHVLSSSDSHLIAESIGQCFNVAYQQFLQSNCIEPQSLTQADFNQLLDTQEMYHDDLVHYSKQENVKEIWVEKKNGETMGIAIVESGWGSIIPTVILANLQHGSPIERNGKFSIGDQIMAINGTSLVGLPLQTCHSIIKGLRNQTLVKINIVSCPPVVSVLIKRPNLKHQLGFSVQNGIICSLMRGGIAERGGVRVGHRIIEINNQSVVATPHDKIVQMLVTSVGEIQMKTMPAAMYRLLTGQEQPIYL